MLSDGFLPHASPANAKSTFINDADSQARVPGQPRLSARGLGARGDLTRASWRGRNALVETCNPPAQERLALQPVAVKAGLRAGSWAAACTGAAEGIPGLSSPDAQSGECRDQQSAGSADRYMGAPAIASLATGSSSMDPASDQTDGTAAATLTLPGRRRLGGARRDHPHTAHPHAVVKPLRSISV